MPRLTRWFIKLGLLYLVLSLFLGVLLGGQTFLHLPDSIQAWTRVFLHLFMVGWVTQLIFGVAYWMFPVHSKERPRGREGLAWATFLLLNAGLILR
ncbi:MAG: hypothetical protein ACE5LH_03025, partial [Fidelibacterota bacterium]